jgi:hypothetical protein
LSENPGDWDDFKKGLVTNLEGRSIRLKEQGEMNECRIVSCAALGSEHWVRFVSNYACCALKKLYMCVCLCMCVFGHV